MVGRANHHDALVRTASMKLVATESAMSSSEVRIKVFASVPGTIRFWVLMLVGLRFRFYETHRF